MASRSSNTRFATRSAAFARDGRHERARASGMDAYLAKPVRLKDLAALFDSLDRRRASVAGGHDAAST